MSSFEHDRTVEQRIARLERLVEELRAEVAAGRTAAGGQRAATGHAGAGSAHADPTAEGASWRRFAQQGAGADAPSLATFGEHWLGRVGVAFVILAFGFLFKYALDQGWLGPAARLSLGLATGVVMLLIGLRLEGSRERYSQYLIGGAIALFYLVGFAAYQLYGLVPFPFAFAFMSATTVLAFVLAERQRLPGLAVIGASGGLGTPFLLYNGSGNVPGLTAYTTILLAGAGTVQFWRGWRSLLLVLGFGGLLVMGIAVAGSSGLEDWIVLAGVLAVWVLFGAAPLLRASLSRSEPDAWPEPPLPDFLARSATPEGVARFLLRLGCVCAALVAAVEIGVLFQLEDRGGTAMLVAGFAVYALLTRTVFETARARNAAAETASILLALAIVLVMADWWMVLPLAVLGAAMHGARAGWDLPGVGVLAHVLFGVLTLSYASAGIGALGIFAAGWTFPVRLSLLLAIGTAFATSFLLPERTGRNVYRFLAHVAFMLWLAVELAPLPEGQGLISLAWGVYGVTLLLGSFRVRERGLQLTALGTLGVVAGKLLLVDMAQLDVIWRILLFMGFGSAFLGLSYLINRPEAERR